MESILDIFVPSETFPSHHSTISLTHPCLTYTHRRQGFLSPHLWSCLVHWRHGPACFLFNFAKMQGSTACWLYSYSLLLHYHHWPASALHQPANNFSRLGNAWHDRNGIYDYDDDNHCRDLYQFFFLYFLLLFHFVFFFSIALSHFNCVSFSA